MLTILGGGGWFPAHGRETACALLRDGGNAIMIDAGTGVGRLIERPELIEGVGRLDIVLTHFHLDHIAGLAYLSACARGAEVVIWGPGRLLYGSPTATILERMLHEPIHPMPLEEQGIEVRDLPAGDLELGERALSTRRQERHSAPSLGLRFGDCLAWITDTAFDPQSGPFAAGCAVLAHEAWCTSAKPRNPDIHSSAAQASQVAAAAGAEQLVLIHLPPFEASVEALVAEAEGAVAAVEGGLVPGVD
jgi:ribonuclease BN (tRNA processing enzyme)